MCAFSAVVAPGRASARSLFAGLVNLRLTAPPAGGVDVGELVYSQRSGTRLNLPRRLSFLRRRVPRGVTVVAAYGKLRHVARRPPQWAILVAAIRPGRGATGASAAQEEEIDITLGELEKVQRVALAFLRLYRHQFAQAGIKIDDALIYDVLYRYFIGQVIEAHKNGHSSNPKKVEREVCSATGAGYPNAQSVYRDLAGAATTVAGSNGGLRPRDLLTGAVDGACGERIPARFANFAAGVSNTGSPCTTSLVNQGTPNEVVSRTSCSGVTFNGVLLTPQNGNRITSFFPETGQASCNLQGISLYCLFPSAVSSSGPIDVRFQNPPSATNPNLQMNFSQDGGRTWAQTPWFATGP